MENKYDVHEIEKCIDSSKVIYNEPMSKHTTIKIGGPADVLVQPNNVKEIKAVLGFAKENSIPVCIIGNGSKLLVTDAGIRGIVIKLWKNFAHFNVEGEYIRAQAGVFVPKLAIIARDNELSGLEFAAGIPGVLGGSIRMNAGAYNGEMSDIVCETTYIDENFEVKTMDNDSHEFRYRHSIFVDNPKLVIIESKLKLVPGNRDEIASKMIENNKSRREKQPLEYPNAGSTFKRPEGLFVGTMIQELGLKGYSIGDAQVSEKHAGFIVNRGNAKAQHVIDLMNYIRQKVHEKYNVMLENEIEIIGE